MQKAGFLTTRLIYHHIHTLSVLLVFQDQNNKKDADSGNEFVSAVAWRPVSSYCLLKYEGHSRISDND